MEPELVQLEVLDEEGPRYLRRQRPTELRRRKSGWRTWPFYARVVLGGVAVVAGGWLAYQTAEFLLYSPRIILAHPDQIQLIGNHYVIRTTVLERFYADRGRSVFRVPLAQRRRQLEQIPWVEQARVQRVLPNRIRVELVERQPVAFLRLRNDLALLDAHGVILTRPLGGNFHFPVVAGITEAMPRAERERRMQIYARFLREIELARPGAADHVSEVNLSDASDIYATLAGMPELGDPRAGGQETVVVRFGDDDFLGKYHVLMENLSQWRAAAGRIASVDLRFQRQAVVNPEPRAASAQSSAGVGAPRKKQ